MKDVLNICVIITTTAIYMKPQKHLAVSMLQIVNLNLFLYDKRDTS
jgi:hypothetical protein